MSKYLVLGAAGVLLGAVEVVSGFVFHPDQHAWYSIIIGYSNVAPASFTLACHFAFHPDDPTLRSIFYFAIVAQWTLIGAVIGWFWDTRVVKRRRHV